MDDSLMGYLKESSDSAFGLLLKAANSDLPQ